MAEARQANPIEAIPEGAAVDVGMALWTPDGLEYIQSWLIEEKGYRGVKHEFRFTYKGEVRYFGILDTINSTPAQVEDLAGEMVIREAKRIIETLQARGSKLVPEQVTNDIPIRRELAAVMREYIRHARRRAQTTTGRLYQPAIGGLA